jgi:predicted dithiol-disulfide oxidoreductase (DUF899 family)
MPNHNTVSLDKWIELRKELLKKEKEFTQKRDALTQEIRTLPWVKIDKKYEFAGSRGKETLSDLFAGKSQLVVYHFMLGPGWEEGCPSCSFWADNFNGIPIHLAQRDVSFVAVSRAPLEEIERYRKRMGWSFRWVSSFGSDFNFDLGVSFDEEKAKREGGSYNFQKTNEVHDEMPGLSVFAKEGGDIFRTYSTYARGLDVINGAYQILDLVPKGRDEAGLPWTMAWLKRHDEYRTK